MGVKVRKKKCLWCGRVVGMNNVVLEPVGYQCIKCFFALEYWDGNIEQLEGLSIRYRKGGAWQYPPDGTMLVMKDL